MEPDFRLEAFLIFQWFSTFQISMSSLNSDWIQMEPNGPDRVHLVPFVYCQSYTLVRVNLDPLKEPTECLKSMLRTTDLMHPAPPKQVSGSGNFLTLSPGELLCERK